MPPPLQTMSAPLDVLPPSSKEASWSLRFSPSANNSVSFVQLFRTLKAVSCGLVNFRVALGCLSHYTVDPCYSKCGFMVWALWHHLKFLKCRFSGPSPNLLN